MCKARPWHSGCTGHKPGVIPTFLGSHSSREADHQLETEIGDKLNTALKSGKYCGEKRRRLRQTAYGTVYVEIGCSRRASVGRPYGSKHLQNPIKKTEAPKCARKTKWPAVAFCRCLVTLKTARFVFSRRTCYCRHHRSHSFGNGLLPSPSPSFQELHIGQGLREAARHAKEKGKSLSLNRKFVPAGRCLYIWNLSKTHPNCILRELFFQRGLSIQDMSKQERVGYTWE